MYRPINNDLLNKNFHGEFTLYYKSNGLGKEQYLVFSGTETSHQQKVRDLLDSGDLEEQLYIHEKDLFQFFEQATQALRGFVNDPEIPVEKKTQKVYDVSQNIMKEFFEFNASTEILKTSEQVMELMENCLQQKDVGFAGISKILSKDYYTYTHGVNVGLYAMTYGFKSNMSQNKVRDLGLGGMLHDVGKSKIPSEILNKKGKLTDEEFLEIKKHPEFGLEILNGLGCYGDYVHQMTGHHHEKFDGSGYPRALTGEEIPYAARVCKIVDVFDALTTQRSYKKAMKPIQALVLMKNEMTPDFDPEILNNFIRLMGPGG